MHVGKIKNLRVLALCFLALVVTPLPMQFDIGSVTTTNELLLDSFSMDEKLDLIDSNNQDYLLDVSDSLHSAAASEPSDKSGKLDPIIIEQRGYSTTENISARTDANVNLQQDLDIDIEHDWLASTADVHLENLQQLYVLNGTYDQGLPGINIQPNGTVGSYPFGWTSDSNDTSSYDDDVQISMYDDTEQAYVAVENQGAKSGQNGFVHDIGTKIVWAQTVENVPHTDNFSLNFEYFYLRGPLDLNSSLTITGNCSINVYIDGVVVWNMSLLTLSERAVWTEIGEFHISLPGAPASFMFEIGLEIDESLTLDKRFDYDDNGLEDGSIHTQYITVYFDDLSLVASSPPSYEEVGLEFSIDGMISGIIGDNGIGSGSITNPSYWSSPSLSFSIYANTNVSFDYHIHLLNHRFINSSWRTDFSSDGVSFSVAPGESADINFFTYIGIVGIYDNLTLRIHHPIDWTNYTIQDPFLTDKSSSCIYETGLVIIPTEVLDILGWWQISCQSPNYESISMVERYDEDSTNWIEESVYHTDDQIRLFVNIESELFIPLLNDAVNFTWALPNGTTWSESSIISGELGSVISTSITFGSTNTTAGIWSISYIWKNGTELAYGTFEFFLHHDATLEVVFEDELETVVGQPVTVVMRFYDVENGLLLLNDGASISGTWAGGTVDFEPNVVKNWWQADFDTALVGAGNFEVSVNSSAPFFETTPVVITIKSQYLTELDSPSGPLEPLVYGRSYNFDFFYSQSFDGLGIDGALVEITEEGSEWASTTDNGTGHYNLTLTPLGERDYSIRISFSKVGYKNQTFVLSFLVEKVPIKVNLISSLSGSEFEIIDVEIAVVEVDTDNPVQGANVTLSIVSSAGTVYALQDMIETDGGHYVSNFSMPLASEVTYNMIIQVAKENYEMVQEFHATLVPIVDTDARLFQAIIDYSWQIAIGASMLVAVVVGQRAYVRKNKRKYAAARVIKTRFNDAHNLLGIIVLHKLSGVPIYSKMMKVGFEEGMLSAFITAIMHFRSEFETTEERDEYHILPISDIIRAVSTPNLLCAFITVSSASPEQETKMIGYARAIGMMLDATLAEAPTKVIDAKTAKTLEWFFDDFVDGGLLRKYQIGEKDLPRRFKIFEKAISLASTNDTFKLDMMIRGLENCGLSDDDAYLLIMDAIDNEFILPIYPFNDILDTDVEEN